MRIFLDIDFQASEIDSSRFNFYPRTCNRAVLEWARWSAMVKFMGSICPPSFPRSLLKAAESDLISAVMELYRFNLKAKTTSPKKYFVWQNTCIIQPWDSCFIRGFTL